MIVELSLVLEAGEVGPATKPTLRRGLLGSRIPSGLVGVTLPAKNASRQAISLRTMAQLLEVGPGAMLGGRAGTVHMVQRKSIGNGGVSSVPMSTTWSEASMTILVC